MYGKTFIHLVFTEAAADWQMWVEPGDKPVPRVNRNVNVNNNVNVNRNVNVNGGYYGGGCCYQDDPNWGAVAAGAAIGVATTAAVAAATRPAPTTVVVAPPLAVGTTVGVLPGGCATIQAGDAMIYNCSNVYYRPFYQGTSLVYQVVTYPSTKVNCKTNARIGDDQQILNLYGRYLH